MSVYQRYASGDHDEQFFSGRGSTPPIDGLNHSIDYDQEETENSREKSPPTEPVSPIVLHPLSGHFDETVPLSSLVSEEKWLDLSSKAAYFQGYDHLVFGHVVTIVFQHSKTNKISTKSITKYGISTYDNIILDSRSRFWPSCENLLPEYQKSNVRRALAITNLKNYSRLINNSALLEIDKNKWDETVAGELANSMQLMGEVQTPQDLGAKLLQLGLVQLHKMPSTVIDVVYDNSPQTSTPQIVEENNKLVYLIGEQLEQLFDPLLEYSPEAMQISYAVPDAGNHVSPLVSSEKIDSVISELITVQTNFTMGLVNLLQDFIIPLRISVLSSEANSGIAKLNSVFPPTIDEITRINCIFHDALGKAQPFGYVEVFKVIGLILPYFYKAFIRHEANLKNFPSKLSKFSHKYKNKVFDNPEINKGSFSLREIDSVVNGSLLELPKIKLILRRMYISIQSEKEDLRGTKEDEEDKIINESFGAAIDIIDAFGGANSFSNSEAVEERQRIFTPTGKILTQLATKWPAELQYGWLTRKVVGIFELRHVCPKQGSLQDTEVLIIFSDHLVFLTVVDDSYYVKRDDKSRNKKISISDILMHSLINEKPLPKLSSFPSMEVSAWCEINDVVVSSYKAPTMILTDSQPATGCQGDFLRFLNKTSSGYNTSNKDISFSRIYEVVGGSKSNSQQSGINIIDLVSKSKILHKSQPFHLFKSKTMGLNVYSTAHDFEAYQQETWKSPFAMFLNISFSDPYEYFEKNPDLYLLINASFLTDDKIQLIAYNRQKTIKTSKVIPASDLQGSIREMIYHSYESIFSSYNEITQSLVNSNADELTHFVDVYPIYDREKLKSEYLERIESEEKAYDKKDKGKNVKRHSKKASAAISLPDDYIDHIAGHKAEELPIAEEEEEEEEEKEKEAKANESSKAKSKEIQQQQAVPSVSMKNVKKRKSLLQKIFHPFKKNHERQANAVPLLRQPTTESDREFTTSFIPKGNKQKFQNIYKPVPELVEKESIVCEDTPIGRSKDKQVKNTKEDQNEELLVPRYEPLVAPLTVVPESPTKESPPTPPAHKIPIDTRLPKAKEMTSKIVKINRSKRNHSLASFIDLPDTSDDKIGTLSKNVANPNNYNNKPNDTSITNANTGSIPDKPKFVKINNDNEIRIAPVTPKSLPPVNNGNRATSNGSSSNTSTYDNVLVLDSINNNVSDRKSDTVEHLLNLVELPVEEFYNDGESNWIALSMSRENSSLHHNLPSLKEDVNDTQLSAKAKSLERIAEISGSNTIDNFAQMDLDQIGVDTIDPATTPQVLSASEFEKPPEIGSFGFMKGRKEDSVQSLTPIEIAEEFSRTIDFEFATSRNLRELSIANSGSQEPLDIAEEIVSEESERSVSEIRTSRNGRIRQENLIRERPDSLIITSGLNISSITLTSSEDEFFSPDEFAPSVIQGLTNSFAKCAPSPTISSDGTIINDHIHDDATVSFDTTGGHQKSGVITEDSMAQLSEFLNGTINFGEFSLES